MISNSVIAMTVVDLIVLVAVGIMIAVALKSRRMHSDGRLGLGTTLMVLGAMFTGFFYLVDLVVVLILPSVVGDLQAMSVLSFLHLDLRWIVTLGSVVLICIGFVITNLASRKDQKTIVEAENTFRSIAETSTDLIWQIDKERRNVFINDRVEKVLGYTRSEIARLPIDSLIHAEDMIDVNRRLPLYVKEKRGWERWLLRCFHKNGGIRYLSTSGGPAFDESGKAQGFRGISRDISFQFLQAEISARLLAATSDEIDQRINTALDQIAQVYRIDRISLWWRGESGSEFHRSHAASQSDGDWAWQQTSHISDMPWGVEILSKGKILAIEEIDDVPKTAHVDRAYLQSQGIGSVMVIPLIVDRRRLAISVFVMLGQSRAWPESEQNELSLLTQSLAVAFDRHQSMETIRRREQDLARAERLAAVGNYSFSITGPPGVFPPTGQMETSQQLKELHGTETSGATFAQAMSRVHRDDRDRVMTAFRELIEHGSSLSQDYRIVQAGGSIRYLATHSEVDRDENGDAIRVFGSCNDITELATALSDIEALKDRLEEENVELRQEIRAAHGFDRIVGESLALRECLHQVAAVAATDVAVLISGETGTGKELIAQSIHDLSRRKDQRMVSFNCATLPVELFESELFGHEKGAFTGAHSRRLGRFELADGGTLFLDELGELPQPVQSKLLRVLQDGSFERVGGNETLYADVRLIAATNRHLQRAVEEGEFRADLFYRINTFPIEVPSLRSRKEDIPLLAEHFVRKHAARFGKSVEAISTRMLRYLQEREWPGNVRELESFIERSLIAMTGPVLTLEGLELPKPVILDAKLEGSSGEPGGRSGSGRSGSVKLREFERNHIIAVLEQCTWVIDGKKGAATVLGLAPSTLRSKMKRHGIERTA